MMERIRLAVAGVILLVSAFAVMTGCASPRLQCGQCPPDVLRISTGDYFLGEADFKDSPEMEFCIATSERRLIEVQFKPSPQNSCGDLCLRLDVVASDGSFASRSCWTYKGESRSLQSDQWCGCTQAILFPFGCKWTVVDDPATDYTGNGVLIYHQQRTVILTRQSTEPRVTTKAGVRYKVSLSLMPFPLERPVQTAVFSMMIKATPKN